LKAFQHGEADLLPGLLVGGRDDEGGKGLVETLRELKTEHREQRLGQGALDQVDRCGAEANGIPLRIQTLHRPAEKVVEISGNQLPWLERWEI
jgi:hypothetical protein